MTDDHHPLPDTSSTFPDFARLDAATQAYEAAKLRYIRSETSVAENELRETFATRRAEINGQIEALRDVFTIRQAEAVASARRYGAAFPERVRGAQILPPSLWERIVTFNRVAGPYREAVRCATEVEAVKDMLRKRRERLEAIEQQTRRSIYLREEAVRKHLQTRQGLDTLQNDPYVHAAYVALQAAMSERARYDERVRDGRIAPGDARDRDMAARGWAFASLPLDDVTIAGIVRYSELAYYLLRDGEQRESLLACDPALEPLRDRVFDLQRGPGGFSATLRKRQDGVPEHVLDHLKRRFPADEVPERYARHRSTMRSDPVTAKTPTCDDVEAQLVSALAMLAATLAPDPAPTGGTVTPIR